MHVQTHILSGWCVANVLPGLNARQRLFCMLAASLEDIDGLGILISQEAFWALHHKLGHCLLFGVVSSGMLAWLSPRVLFSFLIYLSLFHLHLLLDVLGSGPHWDIFYLWPFDQTVRIRTDIGWELYSWQNITTFFVLLAWTIGIAMFRRRTPLEMVVPSLDQRFVRWLAARNWSWAAERADS